MDRSLFIAEGNVGEGEGEVITLFSGERGV